MIAFLKKYLRMKKQQLFYPIKPLYLVLTVTENCNSRCTFCNFWQTRKKDELSLSEIKQMFNSPMLDSLVSITLTGGEPLLRKDINEIVAFVHKKTGVKPAISTNGLIPKMLERFLQKSSKHIGGITFSVDGPKEVHEKIRGVKGSLERVDECIKIVEKNGLGKRLTLSMTLTKENYKHLLPTFMKYRKYNFSFTNAESAENWFGDIKDKQFEFTSEQIENVIRQIKVVQKYTGKRTYDLFLQERLKAEERTVPCYAGRYEVFVSSKGIVQPCFNKKPWGDLKKQSFTSIWKSNLAYKKRKKFIHCKKCYRRCNVSIFWINPIYWKLRTLLKK